MEELAVSCSESLAANGLHGSTKAGQDREAGDIGESETERPSRKLELPQPT